MFAVNQDRWIAVAHLGQLADVLVRQFHDRQSVGLAVMVSVKADDPSGDGLRKKVGCRRTLVSIEDDAITRGQGVSSRTGAKSIREDLGVSGEGCLFGSSDKRSWRIAEGHRPDVKRRSVALTLSGRGERI